MKIIITGTTGVGKSTVVELLETKLKKSKRPVIRMGELVVNSEFFDYYFENLSEWGFLSQTSFLLDRFKQWIEVEHKINNYVENAINIFDRHFLDDLIFSELDEIKETTSNIETIAYKVVYEELLKKLENAKKIDFLFLLKADFDVIAERMRKRGRENETAFEVDYWKDLYYRYYEEERYQKHFQRYSKKMIIIDTTHKNPLEVVKEIISYLDLDKGNN